MTTLHDYITPTRTAAAGTDEDTGTGYPPLKAAADIAMALPLLLLSAPLIVLLMALIKLSSRGPALYTQVRLGYRGRPFVIYKLRTMTHNCERISGVRWAMRHDPRATPLGRVLRRLHLDELPQLWNVLRGEMSLVGPRPERPEIADQLERAVPQYRDRLRVPPGITGLAQVRLPADEDLAGVSRKVDCDLRYIGRMGPWLDARILAGTALKVLGVPRSAIGWLLRLPGEADPPAHGGHAEGHHQLQPQPQTA